MKRGIRTRKASLVVLLAMLVLTLTACPKTTQVSASPEAVKGAGSQGGQAAPAQPGSQSAIAGQQALTATSAEKDRSMSNEDGLKPIYFDFDRSDIRADAREIMKTDAEWLKAHPNLKIRIEGNCDERGTKEYNLALGQRRAASAKRYLTDLGVASARISLISYGKEKPACAGSSDSCMQQDRRDDLVMKQ